MAECKKDGCIKPVHARKMCVAHYHQWYRSRGQAVNQAPAPASTQSKPAPERKQGWSIDGFLADVDPSFKRYFEEVKRLNG